MQVKPAWLCRQCVELKYNMFQKDLTADKLLLILPFFLMNGGLYAS